MGLLDNINGGGLLPFADRFGDWQSVNQMYGRTLNPGIQAWAPMQPEAAMAQGGPQGGQGTGILPQGPQLPPEMANAQAAPGGQPQGSPWGNLLSGISNGIAAHPQTLMAMAGGFGQPGWGFGNAMRAAGPAMQVERQQQQQLQSQDATYQALRAAGVPHGQAVAAALNPDVLKTIAPELYQKPTWGVIGEGPLGKQYGWIDPNKRTTTSGEGSGSINAGVLAPGVAKMDSSLTGDAYLNQFGPEVQAAVKAYMKGDVMPTGNPRLQGLQPFAKQVAQKYGQDMGIPVSDAIYNEKRRFFTELGSTTTGVGGQSKAFSQGIEHAVALADKLKKLDNSNGFGIPVVAEGINTVRQHFSNTLSAVSDEAATIGQTLAGEVGKLFAGSAGGGVHERELTRQRFNTVKSKPQLAAALEATLETMEGGLTALEQRRDAVLGPNSGVNLIPQQTRDNMNKLRGIISELKTGNAAPASGGVVRWQRGPNGIPQPAAQ